VGWLLEGFALLLKAVSFSGGLQWLLEGFLLLVKAKFRTTDPNSPNVTQGKKIGEKAKSLVSHCVRLYINPSTPIGATTC